MAIDPSSQPVMAVLDTAIHALRFKSWRRHESQTGLLGIRAGIKSFFASFCSQKEGLDSLHLLICMAGALNSFAGSRKLAKAGSSTNAPSMFHKNMKASNSPISA